MILDHVDNVQLNEDFPVKNMHALKYNLEGIYYLAQNVRNLEIEKYQTDGSYLHMIGLEYGDILMNMFNWFSVFNNKLYSTRWLRCVCE